MTAAETAARLPAGERLAWLRLLRTDNVGPRTFRELVARFGSAEAALNALPELSRRGGRLKPLRVRRVDEAESELERIAAAGAELVAWHEPGYPPALRHIDDAPPLLIARGRLELAARPIVALVGARNASALGRRMATLIAGDLGRAGFAIASGLARGIDTASHLEALDTGTIAAIAGGIDVAYPPDNADLQERIGREGLVVTEMPPGTKPVARHFPRRNRLISGMSRAVVVVEAAQRSGSLITARLALEQGREVFAVPGPPLDPRAAGANALIRDGATLTRGADDVLEVLDPMLRDLSAATRPVVPSEAVDPGPAPIRDELRNAVASLIGLAPTPIDEVVRHSGASPGEVAGVLLELELAGRLARHGGQLVSLIPDR